MKSKFTKFIVFALSTQFLFALNYEIILKIKKPESSDTFNKKYPSFIDVRPDGSFIAKYIYDEGSYPGSTFNRTGIGIIWLVSGKSYVFKLKEITKQYNYTEVDEGIFGSGQIIEVTEKKLRGLNIALQTANEKGYLVDEVSEVIKETVRFNSQLRKFYYSNYKISKYDSNGNFLSSIELPLKSNTDNPQYLDRNFSVSFKLQDFQFDYPSNLEKQNILWLDSDMKSINSQSQITNNKNIYFTKEEDGELIFYRLTDSDLLSSPNRITLGSSQNGSLTATVNNPEQALLNIQSSTNLIDWNTFKTIQNEPSLEIVVPANKPKEFIRAIE